MGKYDLFVRVLLGQMGKIVIIANGAGQIAELGVLYFHGATTGDGWFSGDRDSLEVFVMDGAIGSKPNILVFKFER